MAIDFPNSPATNSTHTVGGKTWKYDGEKWISVVVTEPISLGLETNGNYVQSLNAGTGVTITGNNVESATPTISIGQDVSTGATPLFYSLETSADLIVGGDLHVTGTLITTTETSLAIEDPFIYLNDGATPSNPDMGFVGNYNDGSYKHAGFFRDASDNTFKAFYGYEPEPGSPINVAHASYQNAPIQGEKFISTVATGTAPLMVSSTTEVVNLRAATATKLNSARNIQLSGDVTGTASFDGSANINISTTLANIPLGINSLNDVVTVLSYNIGDTGPAGGKIFITPSTVGNTTGRYFEAAPVSSEVSRRWASSSNGNTFVSGADGTAIGTGQQNTIDIVAQSGNTSANSAAVYASEYSLNGYSDWFLPSIDELTTLYSVRALVGGFENALYYSSSESEDNGAFAQYAEYLGGIVQAVNKLSSPIYVRSVRSFRPEASDGEFLKYNGTSWVNSSIDLGTDTTGNYVKSLVAGTGISISNNSGEGATPNISLNASLNDLTDATMTGATPNQVIAYNGTAWTNTTVGDYWNKVNGNNNASYGPSVLISANSNSYNNVGIGQGVLPLLTEGDSNIAIGVNALNKVVDSDENIAIGKSALANATGSYNIAIGTGALFSYNNLWAGSVAVGHQSALNTTGISTTSVGYQTLRSNTTGASHSAFGYSALYSNTTGTGNTAFGHISSEFNTTGSYNTAIGLGALRNNISGSYNVAIGNNAGINETGSNKLYIANSSTSNPLIYGDFSTSLLRVNGALEVTSSLSLTGSSGIIFEGATPNAHETTLNVVEPTEDRTILLPNASGTLSLEDNTAWTSYTPTITADGGGFALNNGTLTGRYKQVGKTVFFKLKFVFGSTTTAGSGHWNFSLPVTAYDSDFTFSASILDDGVAWHGGIGNGNYTGSTSNFVVITTSPSASIATWVPVGNGGPFTWGTADNITVSGSYEAA